MKRRRILYAALFIAALSIMPIANTYAASTAMPSGTVVIGSKAYSLDYANDVNNQSEITSAIVAGGAIYVKNYTAAWVNNSTATIISASVIPSVTYKDTTGIAINYAAGDAGNVTPVDSTPLAVVSID